MPRFFAQPGDVEVAEPVAVVFDESYEHAVQEFLRAELALVEIFVDDPSVEHLHDATSEEQTFREAQIHSFEEYLRREAKGIGGFLAHPSVELLHGRNVQIGAG